MLKLPVGLTLDSQLPEGLTLDTDHPGVTEDMLKTLLPSAARAVTGVSGSVGDVDNALRAGSAWAADKLGFGPGHTILDRLGVGTSEGKKMPPSMFPTTQGERAAIEKVTGPLYEPKTIPGKILDKTIQYAPAAIGTKGLGVLGSTLLPAAAEVGADELTKGTPLEGYAGPAAAFLAPFAANKFEKGILLANARKALPGTPQLKEARDHLYDLSEKAGVRIKPEAWQVFTQGIVNDLKKDRFTMIDTAPPQVVAKVRALADYNNAKNPLSLKDVHQLRQSVGRLIDTDNGVQRGIASKLYGDLSQFMQGLTPQDMVAPSGLAKFGVPLQRAADQLHRRYKNSKVMDTIYERASNRAANYSEAGEATGLTQKFRQLADKFANPDSKEFRFLTPEERDAIRKAARGSIPRKIVKTVATFAPWGLKGSGMTTMLGTAGFAMGGPLGAAIGAGIPAGIGSVGKALYSAMVKIDANRAGDLVRGVAPKVAPKPYPYPLVPLVGLGAYNGQ